MTQLVPLGALNAVTPSEPTGAATFSVNVSGTFVGTVLFERRINRDAAWFPIAADMAGNFVQFTGPSGDLPGRGVDWEPEAEIRARMSAYVSGTAFVRIGR